MISCRKWLIVPQPRCRLNSTSKSTLAIALDAEKEFITMLAAVYAICYLTGGSAVGLSFSVGDQNVTIANNAPPLVVLQGELERILNALKQPILRSA